MDIQAAIDERNAAAQSLDEARAKRRAVWRSLSGNTATRKADSVYIEACRLVKEAKARKQRANRVLGQ